MATDYRINLAKSFTSTPEDRRRFYNGILIYLVLCAAAMVYVAYLTSVNLVRARQANLQRQTLERAIGSASDYGREFLQNPANAYKKLELQAADLLTLRTAFGQRTHFLPVMSGLFSGLPEDVALQDLQAVAEKKTLSFGLVVPLSDQEKGDPVRKLKSVWDGNEELMRQVHGIRPVTGERRVVNGQPVFFVQFECILK